MAVLLWILAILELAGGIAMGYLNQSLFVGGYIGLVAFAVTGGLAVTVAKLKKLSEESSIIKHELGLNGGLAAITRALQELSTDTSKIREDLNAMGAEQKPILEELSSDVAKIKKDLLQVNAMEKLIEKRISMLQNNGNDGSDFCDDGDFGLFSVSGIIQAKKAQAAKKADKDEDTDAFDDALTFSDDERLDRFFEAISEMDGFTDIAKEWEDQGLSGDLMYSDIEREILENSESEKVNGGKADPEEVSAFADRIKSELGIEE